MPKSIIEERVNAAWDGVTAAVSKGLAGDGEKTLADVVPIVVGQPASATWCPATTQWPPVGQLRLRESEQPPTVIDYEFRLYIDYDALTSPNTGQIAEWAATVRTFELFDVLDRLAAEGQALDVDVEQLRDAAPSGGWGEVRCVTFKLGACLAKSIEVVKQFGWDGPVLLAERLPVQSRADCLLFRKGGGPHVRRAAGPTLGWLPDSNGGVNLILAEQYEIVNAGRQTVTAIRLDAGLKRPRPLTVTPSGSTRSERVGPLAKLKRARARVCQGLQAALR